MIRRAVAGLVLLAAALAPTAGADPWVGAEQSVWTTSKFTGSDGASFLLRVRVTSYAIFGGASEVRVDLTRCARGTCTTSLYLKTIDDSEFEVGNDGTHAHLETTFAGTSLVVNWIPDPDNSPGYTKYPQAKVDPSDPTHPGVTAYVVEESASLLAEVHLAELDCVEQPAYTSAYYGANTIEPTDRTTRSKPPTALPAGLHRHGSSTPHCPAPKKAKP